MRIWLDVTVNGDFSLDRDYEPVTNRICESLVNLRGEAAGLDWTVDRAGTMPGAPRTRAERRPDD
jgi:hypothetical protein